MTAAELCRGAAAVIRARGWRQGNFGDADGPVCALGALNVAGGHAPDCKDESVRGFYVFSKPEHKALLQTLVRDGAAHAGYSDEEVGGRIIEWNDSPARTVGDVLNVLERTAMRLESES